MVSFELVSWNVLASGYIRRSFYPRVEPRFLDARWRHPAIVRRAIALDADVLCLQEIDTAVFTALSSALEPAGYVGRHVLKEAKPDGCATFVRASRFTWVESRRHVYGDGSGHIAQIAILEHENERLAIANTHLKWDPPETPHARSFGMRQAREALDVLRHEPTLAQIMCGDLNVMPKSDVMRVLLQGLADAHESAASFTSNANGVAKRIDYFLWRGPLAARPHTPSPIADDTPLPSEDEPSDHLPLAASFTFDDSLTERARVDRGIVAVQAAIAALSAGRSHDERCPFCGGPLAVSGTPAGGPFSSWDIHCGCGKANGTLKGL